MLKKIIVIIAAVLLVALVAAGSFWGGMTYQNNQASATLDRFEADRGQFAPGEFPADGSDFSAGGFPGGQAPGGLAGRGTSGQVKALDGDVLTLSTAQDVTTVKLSDSTQIEKTVAGESADLQPGTRVLITGQADDSGAITAERIQIISADAAFLPETPPQGQEP